MEQISRRKFIRLSAFVVAGTAATACAGPASAPAQPGAGAATAAPAAAATQPAVATVMPAAASKYAEAPMLAALVKEGKLPPVDQRLPKTPWVVPNIEGVGKYGGAYHDGYRGTSEQRVGWFLQEDLLYYDPELNLKPNICESFTVNDKGTEFTFKLREGIKWSDGQPLTADDYVWWHTYYATDESLSPGGLNEYRTTSPDGKPELAKCEALDQYTVKYTFARPKVLFLHSLARYRSHVMPNGVLPSHYMKQYHNATTADKAALEAQVKTANAEGWTALFLNMANAYLNPALPTLSPWQFTAAMPQDLLVLKRNPYFYGVDSAGNQLPYLDEQKYRYFDKPETANLWLLNGEIDLWDLKGDIAAAQVLKDREAQADMMFLRWRQSGIYGVSINHSTKNDRLRELFHKRDFRLALSHALNRDEINQVIFEGSGTPSQVAPIKGSNQYNEKAATSFLEYKPDEANRLLDGLGLTEKNAEGYRLYPGTQDPVGFIILQTEKPDDIKIQEMAIKYWKDAGIKVTLSIVQRNQYFADTQTNNVEAGGWTSDRTFTLWKDPGMFLGRIFDKPYWPGYALWRQNPDDPNAVKPPEDHFIWDLWKVWEKCELEPDDKKRDALFQEFLEIWGNEVPVVGIVNGPPVYLAKKKTLRGLPKEAVLNWASGYTAQYMCEQYWWEDPEKHV